MIGDEYTNVMIVRFGKIVTDNLITLEREKGKEKVKMRENLFETKWNQRWQAALWG